MHKFNFLTEDAFLLMKFRGFFKSLGQITLNKISDPTHFRHNANKRMQREPHKIGYLFSILVTKV